MPEITEASGVIPVKRPKGFNRRELRNAGVEIVEAIAKISVTLKCLTCGQVWRPDPVARGRLSGGYWKCPNGCNSEVAE